MQEPSILFPSAPVFRPDSAVSPHNNIADGSYPPPPISGHLPLLCRCINPDPERSMEMWKYRVVGSVAALLLLLAIVLPFTQTQTQSVRDKAAMAEDAGPLVGGIKDSPMGQENDLEVIALARFAVSEHNNKANALLEFENVVKLKKQTVAGTMHYITIRVNEGGAKKLYEAKVWEKSWENFKQLQEFKPVEDAAIA